MKVAWPWRRRDEELDEEIRSHLRMAARERVERGEPPERAEAEALKEFGNEALVREATRKAWGWAWARQLLRDARFGLRSMRREPGFAAAAILTLALGIGATTAVFSLVDAFLLMPLPVRDPQQLVIVRATRPKGGTTGDFAYTTFEQFRDHNHMLSGLFAYDESHVSVTTDGRPEYLNADFVTGGYFDVLGVGAALGRTFSADDDGPGKPPVAVLSYGYWQHRFAGERAVVGKSIYVGKVPVTVIGITPPWFFGRRAAGHSADIVLPMSVQPQLALRDHNTFAVMARLKPDVSPEQARDDLDVIYQQALSESADTDASAQTEQELRAQKIQLRSGRRGTTNSDNDLEEQLPIMFAVVGLVLLIACANVANLLLARGTTRGKEMAVRLAVGASRLRLIRQLLTESLLLATLGGALGVLFAQWGATALLKILFYGEPSDGFEPVPDLRVLVFTVAVCALTGIIFGLAPALTATKIDVAPVLKGGDAGGSGRPARRRLTKSLVVAQVALSLALLVGAGLLIRSLRQLYVTDTGFERERVLTMWAFPALIGYDQTKELHLYRDLLERLNSTPGVESASLSRFSLTRGPKVNYVGPRFFETQGIRLVEGREFSDADAPDTARVAILSESLVRKYFPSDDPLGRRLPDELGRRYGSDAQVVGVVKDTRHGLRQQGWDETLYLPYTQAGARELGQAKFHVRTAGRPSGVIPAIRQQVQAVEKDLPLVGLQTQAEELEGFLGEERSLATLLSFFGVLALALASIGLYGTMSYAVGKRVKEIGLRMALGARRRQILWMVLREAMSQVVFGICIGLAASLALTRLLKGMLFGVTETDSMALAGAVLLMTLVALVACLVPARRATKVDPMVALRYE